MRLFRTVGKFYTRIIMKNVGIFIFIGLLSVIFNEHGWFPNRNIYAISQLVYEYILPAMIAYEGGRSLSGDRGGVLASMAVTGLLISGSSMGILSAMFFGPLAGIIWKKCETFLDEKVAASMQMVMRNLCLGILGCLLAVAGYMLVLPVLEIFTAVISEGMYFLVSHQMEPLLSIVIEPAKIFFLNNVINHGILVPLAMGELWEKGSSVLFLMETNPGPGFGMLLALYIFKRERRSECAGAMFAELIGGIHEVYFPFVLSDMRLLIALIAGGLAGNFCFEFMQAGVEGVVSPGSLIVLILMAGREAFVPVLTGVTISAGVAFVVSGVILRISVHNKNQKTEETAMTVLTAKRIEKVVFICDGGVGSSAMGAALFRRTLAQKGITGVKVEAFAADLAPDDADILVCQKDFYRMLPEKLIGREIYTVDNLVQTTGFESIIEVIEKRQNI